MLAPDPVEVFTYRDRTYRVSDCRVDGEWVIVSFGNYSELMPLDAFTSLTS